MTIYLLLDGVRLYQQLEQAKELNKHHCSLYPGETDQNTEALSPYLFTYPHSDEFRAWYIQNGLNNHWSILVESSISFEEEHKHFRHFLNQSTKGGQEIVINQINQYI